jgi:hypothetical protein
VRDKQLLRNPPFHSLMPSIAVGCIDGRDDWQNIGPDLLNRLEGELGDVFSNGKGSRTTELADWIAVGLEIGLPGSQKAAGFCPTFRRLNHLFVRSDA